MRDYLHVLDLAKGHLLALDALAPGSKAFDDCPAEARYKAYNLGRGQGMSVLQIVEAMRKATGFDYKYTIVGRRYGFFSSLSVAVLLIGLVKTRRCARFDRRPDSCGKGARLQS